MANIWLTDPSIPVMTSPDDADLQHVIDVSDVGPSPQGTSNKVTLATLKSYYVNSTFIFATQSALSSQIPSTLLVPETIDLGPDQSNPFIDLTSNVITFLQDGVYHANLVLRIGRTDSTGRESIAFQGFLNGIAPPVIPREEFTIANNSESFSYSFYGAPLLRVNGDTFHMEMAVTDEQGGVIDIGLYEDLTAITGFNTAPTASLNIFKFV